ncbi:MAG TPA: type II toxin-antitoxin system RelE/ParE family toxin [Verrucomicrobiae bacterium]|nr:type II toxin-antitoxin system RelE/ParE family toxin [Verrucomicrobiae bacterium]
MSLVIQKSSLFHTDVTNQFAWYFDEAGEKLAWQFFQAVDQTLQKLSHQPDLGRVRHFRNPVLHGLRSFRVEPPFQRLLIFYRHDNMELFTERLIHGARNLPRRLAEPPDSV